MKFKKKSRYNTYLFLKFAIMDNGKEKSYAEQLVKDHGHKNASGIMNKKLQGLIPTLSRSDLAEVYKLLMEGLNARKKK